MSELSETSRFLTEEIENGLLMTAAQVCVITSDGECHEFAGGTAGLDVDAKTLFRVGCITKQFTSIAIARLFDDGNVDLETPLENWLPGIVSVAGSGITLRDVLTHTAGLHAPTVPQMEFVPFDQRCDFLCQRQWRPPEWRVGRDGGYSEVLAWHVLGHLVEKCTRESLSVHLRRQVFDPLDLHDTWVGMTHTEYEKNLTRIGLYYDLRGTRPYPIMLDRVEDQCCNTNCAYGAFSTARDLAAFYHLMLGHLAGKKISDELPSATTIRRFCTPSGPPRYDVTFDRVCSFGLGFMCDLATHQLGSDISPNAFGHLGWTGSSFAFGDPDRDIAVAVITNGVLPRPAARLSRARLVRSIYADVARERTGAL